MRWACVWANDIKWHNTIVYSDNSDQPQFLENKMKSGNNNSTLAAALSFALKSTAKAYGIHAVPTLEPEASLTQIQDSILKAGLGLDAVLADAALLLANERLGIQVREQRNGLQFFTSDRRPDTQLKYTSDSMVAWSLSPDALLRAVYASNRTVQIVHDLSTANNVPIFQLLGLRNLSSFVGEIFARELCTIEQGRFLSNPNQDGYPDLCALTAQGKAYVAERRKQGQMSAKQYWSPYPYGGVEVKGTCGNTPAANKCPKPQIGESRYPILVSAEWKAHHRLTNNLIGLFWDFINGLPTVLAVFFRNDLVQNDWGTIIQPKEGGGKTTSVSIMTRDGVQKMGSGWVILPTDATILKRLTQDRVFGVTKDCIERNCSTRNLPAAVVSSM
jgi:hypothetical protein